MVSKLCYQIFQARKWRFVGQLPKHNEKNLLLISPYFTRKEFYFYLAISWVTNYSHVLILPSTVLTRLFTLFYKRNPIVFKSNAELPAVFNKKSLNQRQVNVMLRLNPNQPVFQDQDLKYYQYAKAHNIPITLITVDRVDKMIKFHTAFFPSKDTQRDLVFIQRYFQSHYKKNRIIGNQ